MDVETTTTSRVEISGLRNGPTAAASRFGSYSSVTPGASQELCHLEASEAAGVGQGSVRWSWIAINYDHVQLRVGGPILRHWVDPRRLQSADVLMSHPRSRLLRPPGITEGDTRGLSRVDEWSIRGLRPTAGSTRRELRSVSTARAATARLFLNSRKPVTRLS